jgi:hypothetical protein
MKKLAHVPRPTTHGFRRGDRVKLVTMTEPPSVLRSGRRGTVTYDRKQRRVGVMWDDDGSTAQILVRHLQKLTPVELLAEADDADVPAVP